MSRFRDILQGPTMTKRAFLRAAGLCFMIASTSGGLLLRASASVSFPWPRLQLAPIALPEASDEAAITTARRALQPIPAVASGSVPDNLQAALDEAFNQRPEISFSRPFRPSHSRRKASTASFRRPSAHPFSRT